MTELTGEDLREAAMFMRHDPPIRELLLKAAEKIDAAKSATVFSEAQIVVLARVQALSAETWVSRFEQYKDVGSIRNACLAIGKFGGIMSLLKDPPPDLQEHSKRFAKVWDQTGDLAFTRRPEYE